MRFLSEDGKVFNTEEECKEHEKSVNESKKAAEAREDIMHLSKLLDEMQKVYDELEDAMDKYEKKYGTSFGDLAKKNNSPKKKSDESLDELIERVIKRGL